MILPGASGMNSNTLLKWISSRRLPFAAKFCKILPACVWKLSATPDWSARSSLASRFFHVPGKHCSEHVFQQHTLPIVKGALQLSLLSLNIIGWSSLDIVFLAFCVAGSVFELGSARSLSKYFLQFGKKWWCGRLWNRSFVRWVGCEDRFWLLFGMPFRKCIVVQLEGLWAFKTNVRPYVPTNSEWDVAKTRGRKAVS